VQVIETEDGEGDDSGEGCELGGYEGKGERASGRGLRKTTAKCADDKGF